MYRKEFVRRIANAMRESHMRKPVYAQKHVFHISDDEGNSKDFVVKKKDTDLAFTIDDVEHFVDACICVIEDAVRHGEEIVVHGFGTLGLAYRKARYTKHPVTGEDVDIAARYVPKFISGKDLKLCAKMYELSLGEQSNDMPHDDETDGDDIVAGTDV